MDAMCAECFLYACTNEQRREGGVVAFSKVVMTMRCSLAVIMTVLSLVWLLVATVSSKWPSPPSIQVSGGGRTRGIYGKGGKRMGPDVARTPVIKKKRKRKGARSKPKNLKVGVEDHDDEALYNTDGIPKSGLLAESSTETNICSENSSSACNAQQTSSSFNVTCLTWNMAELSPTEEDCSFMKSFRSSDMVVLGVQECEDIKPRRHEGSRSRRWRALQLATLGDAFEILAQHKIGGMQLAVYAKKKLANRVRGVLILDVACGIGNMINNKGAICVLLRMKNSKTIAIVNAHFAAHSDKVKERNADYARITQTVVSKAPIKWLKKGTSTLAARKLIAKSISKEEYGNSYYHPRGSEGSIKRNIRKPGRSTRKKRLSKNATSKDHNKNSIINDFLSNPLEKVLTAAGIPPDQESMTPAMRKEEQLRRAAASHIKGASSYWPFDATIFMGDLNYRLDIPRLEVEMLKCLVEVESADSDKSSLMKPKNLVACTGLVDESNEKYYRNLQDILSRDQLYKERQGNRVFPGFQEGKIRFLPTFKYDKRSNCFDSSVKMRSPAWCDRILYHINTEGPTTEADEAKDIILLKDYYSIDAKHSDHRPVCAKFTCDFS